LLDLSLRATSDSKELLQKPLLLDIPTAGGKNFSKQNPNTRSLLENACAQAYTKNCFKLEKNYNYFF